MVGSRGFRRSSMCEARRWKRLTVTSSPSRATTIWPLRTSGLHGEQVTVENVAYIAHGHAAHLEADSRACALNSVGATW